MNKNINIIILILLSLLFSQMGTDRSTNFRFVEQIDYSINNFQNETDLIEFINSVVELNQLPGLSTLIVKGEQVIWDHYFGYSNLEDSLLVDENTMFSLASVSKTITATALMQLWEQDMFELDDDIDPYLPFNVNHPDYPFSPITFKMLLTHTSGIKDNWNVMPYYEGDSELELGYYLEQYLTSEGNLYNPNASFTNSTPGTNYSYSNIAVALIGYLVEMISDMPFNEYCNENIFGPLEMNNTAWFLHEIDDIDQIAMPYSLSGGNGNNCYDIGCGIYDESNPCFCDSECTYYDDCCSDYDEVCGEDGTGSSEDAFALIPINHYGYSDYPSGQLRTSALDLSRILTSYINGGQYNGIQILEQETIDLMQTAQIPFIDSEQGIIWYYKTSNQRTLFGHNGGDLGTITEMFYSVSDDIGVIVLCNTSNYYAVIEVENALFDFAEQQNSEQLGDVNQDELLNVQDVIILVNLIINDQYNYLGDINQDQENNIQDIILLVSMIINS